MIDRLHSGLWPRGVFFARWHVVYEKIKGEIVVARRLRTHEKGAAKRRLEPTA